MQVRKINADHLQLVLVTMRMRRNNPSVARFCALSNGATWQRCEYRQRPSNEPAANRWVHQPLMVPMLPSVTPRLVERVRLHHGLAEVKATWGQGYKAMLAEVSPQRRTKP